MVDATYQTFPALRDDEYLDLKRDIAARGVMVPIEVDEDGQTLDGHHRLRACQELGIVDVPTIVRGGWSEDAKHRHVRALNMARRHLTQEQKRQVIAAALVEEPQRSNRQHARDLNVSHETVRTVRQELVATDQIGQLDRTVGADGKERPATRPAAEPRADRALYSSDSPEWYTPRHVIDAVTDVLGPIDLDPCADPDKTVPAGRHFTQAENGLVQEWHGTVYMNPPYGNGIAGWVTKLQHHHVEGHVPAAVALLPARTDTRWFRVLRDHPICFVTGRLRFSDADPAPFPSAAFYLGPDPELFAKRFDDLGDVYSRIRV